MEEIKELTQDKLDEITKNGRTVLEFSAAWCPDCRFLDPFMPQIEKDFPNDKFYKIDRDGSIDIAKKLNISVNTTKVHVCSILQKLSVDDRTQAAVKALKENITG